MGYLNGAGDALYKLFKSDIRIVHRPAGLTLRLHRYGDQEILARDLGCADEFDAALGTATLPSVKHVWSVADTHVLWLLREWAMATEGETLPGIAHLRNEYRQWVMQLNQSQLRVAINTARNAAAHWLTLAKQDRNAVLVHQLMTMCADAQRAA